MKPYYKARIEPDGWLPIPDEVLAAADLKENDEVELLITHGQIIVRKKNFASPPEAKDVNT